MFFGLSLISVATDFLIGGLEPLERGGLTNFRGPKSGTRLFGLRNSFIPLCGTPILNYTETYIESRVWRRQ